MLNSNSKLFSFIKNGNDYPKDIVFSEVAPNQSNGDTTNIAIIPDGYKIANETITKKNNQIRGNIYRSQLLKKKEFNIPTNSTSENVAS